VRLYRKSEMSMDSWLGCMGQLDPLALGWEGCVGFAGFFDLDIGACLGPTVTSDAAFAVLPSNGCYFIASRTGTTFLCSTGARLASTALASLFRTAPVVGCVVSFTATALKLLLLLLWVGALFCAMSRITINTPGCVATVPLGMAEA